MKLKIAVFCLILTLCFAGCQRGDFKFSIVHSGENAPHDGFFVSEQWYVLQGQTVTDDGYIV